MTGDNNREGRLRAGTAIFVGPDTVAEQRTDHLTFLLEQAETRRRRAAAAARWLMAVPLPVGAMWILVLLNDPQHSPVPGVVNALIVILGVATLVLLVAAAIVDPAEPPP